MNVRTTLIGAWAGVAAFASATFGISAASPSSPNPTRHGPSEMFSSEEFARAIDRLEDHAGGSVKLLDVSLSSDTADFLYVDRGREVNFKVTVRGRRVSKGRSAVIGGRAFSLSIVHAGIPDALVARIRGRPGLRRFVPWIVSIDAVFSRRPEWQVIGKTQFRVVAFTASAEGRRLQQTCAQPLPKPSQPVGC